MSKEELSNTETLIMDAIIAGREVQNFLWGESALVNDPYSQNKDVWISVFQKRVDKISEIDFKGKSSIVELRKRLLQQAALSIQALAALQKDFE